MPEDALGRGPVGWEHVVRVSVSSLVRLDEGRQDLPVSSMVIAISISRNLRPLNRLGPNVSHVVTLASIVPGLDLKHVRLKLQNLPKSVLEVLLPSSIPVLVGTSMFELQWGDAHHEKLPRGLGGTLKSLISFCGNHYLPLTGEGPGVPVEDAILSQVKLTSTKRQLEVQTNAPRLLKKVALGVAWANPGTMRTSPTAFLSCLH